MDDEQVRKTIERETAVIRTYCAELLQDTWARTMDMGEVAYRAGMIALAAASIQKAAAETAGASVAVMMLRAAAGSLPIPMLCPNCGKGEPRVLQKDAEVGDLDQVTCPLCKHSTDMYEAQKHAKLKAAGHTGAAECPCSECYDDDRSL